MATQMATSQATMAPQAEAAKKAAEKIDFKMVTFSLAGKEYGIDIMSVKEIAKAGRFTYVPNAAPFVRGVYNLRGDIISVLDLRTFFHLPAERKEEDALESLLILRVDDHAFGVIVDLIDKVVGISAAAIQPPHPIFGDINVKYIKGIVENGGKLYIILDVERIFAPAKAEEELPPVAAARAAAEEPARATAARGSSLASSFVRETISALVKFWPTALNDAWFEERFASWARERAGKDSQLHEPADAEAFLEGFWSPSTGRLWDMDYAQAFMATLPDLETKNVNVWNPGCGKGHETWSVACALRRRWPESRIKVWANDSDLLAISMAPNMVFPENMEDWYAEFMQKGRNGLTFNQQIRDSVFFEFHDVLNASPLPPLDLIVCRDLLSFLPPIDQNRLLNDFSDKLKPAGILVLGANENPGAGWMPVGSGGFPAFRKES